jgi:hypothetical protein
MSELSNYSIESDHIVILAFKDGRKLRVPLGQLPQHLGAHDLEKIRSAIKLRRDFIQRHMPKVALVMVAGGLIALLSVGGPAVAQLFSPPQHAPVMPDHTGIVRNEILPSPGANPDAPPAESTSVSSRPPKVAGKLAAKNVSILKTAPKAIPSPVHGATPIVTPTPTPGPGPSPSPTPSPSPSPSPSATPDPSASDSDGQVAGCAATPTDPTPDCSAP